MRTHPATGEKALYINPQFTRYIIGFKQEESDNLLKFLYDHIAFSQDLQCRLRWKPRTVVLWDNRVTAHSALIDWENGSRRRKCAKNGFKNTTLTFDLDIARITPQAEQPFE